MPFAVALIHQNEGGDAFGISFPDFPGAVSAGDTAEQAIQRGTALLNFHIAGMVEDGETVPEARTLEQLRGDKKFVEDSAGAEIITVKY